MLKFTFKHHPTMFLTATVRPTRSGPNILYNTSLKRMHNMIGCQRMTVTKSKVTLLQLVHYFCGIVFGKYLYNEMS